MAVAFSGFELACGAEMTYFPDGTRVRLKCGSGPAVMTILYQPCEREAWTPLARMVGVQPPARFGGYGCGFYNDSADHCIREFPAEFLEAITP